MLGSLFALALLSRLVSDWLPWYYFGMLHVAAGFWMVGLIVWAVVFIPRMSPRHVDLD